MGVLIRATFILPYTVVLIAYALAKLRDSTPLRAAAWASLTYCLAQNFVGLLGLVGFTLILTGLQVSGVLFATVATVALLPPLIGLAVGTRIAAACSKDSPKPAQTGYALHAFAAVFITGAIQLALAALGIRYT